MTSAIDRFAAAMEEAGEEFGGGEWTCPVHESQRPSISVKQEDDRVLIHCHHGCETKDVVEAVGLTMADLYDKPSSNGHKPAGPVPGPVPDWVSLWTPYPDRRYEYCRADGLHLFDVRRYYDRETGEKTFRQQAPDGTPSVKDIPKVLFNLPAVIEARSRGETLHICEGEKDVHAFALSGLTATCNPGGAGKWRDSYSQMLIGFRDIVVWRDKDDPGHKHADQVIASLKKHVKSARVRLVEARSGKDAWDHLTAGWTVADAVAVLDPVEALLSRMLTPEQLDDLPDPEPLIKGWLTLDTLARVNGEPGSAKSLLALDWSAHIGLGIQWHGHQVTKGAVVYIVAEGARGFKKRKRAWERHFGRTMRDVYFLPEPLQINGPEWGTYTEACKRLGATFIVLDTQRRVTVGVKENDNTEFGVVVDRLDDLRRATGACVLLVHHTPKGGEGGSGAGAVMAGLNTEFGMTKKGNGTTTYVLENTKEKDEAEGAKRVFELEIVQLEGKGESGLFSPPVTSVVLTLAEDSDHEDDPLPDLPEDAAPNKRQMAEIIRRVWADADYFAKGEIKRLARKVMSEASFYRAWNGLVQDQIIVPVTTARGALSKVHFTARISRD